MRVISAKRRVGSLTCSRKWDEYTCATLRSGNGSGAFRRSTTWSTPGPGWMSSPIVPSFFLPPQPRSILNPAIAPPLSFGAASGRRRIRTRVPAAEDEAVQLGPIHRLVRPLQEAVDAIRVVLPGEGPPDGRLLEDDVARRPGLELGARGQERRMRVLG